jgi:thymidine kinase
MFSNIKMDSAELKIVIGPMFSGKTTAIIKQWKINKLKNIKTLVVNYSEDNRYSQTNLSSHDRVEIPCIKLSKMLEVYSFIGESKERIQCILINEGQFFPDLYDVVRDLLQEKHISVFVSGLDGDYKMQKFGQILDLIPMTNSIEKLHSICYNCKGQADFTMRCSGGSNEQKIIGTHDIYKATCRECHNLS